MLWSVEDKDVMSGGDVCWCPVFSTLVGVSVLNVMWFEFDYVGDQYIGREYQSTTCAFISIMGMEYCVFMMYCKHDFYYVTW